MLARTDLHILRRASMHALHRMRERAAPEAVSALLGLPWRADAAAVYVVMPVYMCAKTFAFGDLTAGGRGGAPAARGPPPSGARGRLPRQAAHWLRRAADGGHAAARGAPLIREEQRVL